MTTFTREDYEMAAKAAGLRIKWIGDVAHDCTKLKPDAPAFKGPMWNPPEDDGDAARLEGAMCLNVYWGMASVTVDGFAERYSDHSGDKQKARRHATFRAAFEIGRAMP